MLKITLPDGTVREYDQALSVSELASSIGPGLAKAAVAGQVNGLLVDCAFVIRQDARVSLITAREPQGLEILRRSCALLLGMALKQLHAKAQVVAAAAVGDGFYCGFTLARALGPEDLQRIQTRMIELATANHSLHYVLSSYWSTDGAALAAGPYVPTTRVMSAFALTHASGKEAQRIYGVCWTDQQELQAWQATPQVVVINIDERQIDYSQALTDTLRRAGVHAHSDLRNEHVVSKIRQHRLLGVEHVLVIGQREMEGDFVSLRTGQGDDLGRMSVQAVCEYLKARDGRHRAAPQQSA
ncbi:His/Gly/Thr/Pro-type tRNA ligase C-terminal domain-containing protein [Pseudomonas sp. RA_35y_Pfl2_P32]|uniref:His/Gly/Thr/Pro-type tRNA ligase C-terminal domain-containing protein n=1 Tax=Pseudomonas sp. RA_35y_Pfl2_P32 TaxID=3088705 RepID=UPI0030D6D837